MGRSSAGTVAISLATAPAERLQSRLAPGGGGHRSAQGSLQPSSYDSVDGGAPRDRLASGSVRHRRDRSCDAPLPSRRLRSSPSSPSWPHESCPRCGRRRPLGPGKRSSGPKGPPSDEARQGPAEGHRVTSTARCMVLQRANSKYDLAVRLGAAGTRGASLVIAMGLAVLATAIASTAAP